MRKLAEQFIKEYTRGISNEIENGCYHEWLTPDEARAACIIERKETINKACDFINHYCNRHGVYPTERVKIINDFQKAMEE